MAAAFDGDTAMPSTFLAMRSLHDLDLLLAAAMLAGTDIEALDRAGEFLLRLLAAAPRLVEERVVHVLGHERENVLLGLGIGVVTHGEDCNRCNRRHRSSFLSIVYLPCLMDGSDGTRMSVPPTPADPIEQNRENDDDADEQYPASCCRRRP